MLERIRHFIRSVCVTAVLLVPFLLCACDPRVIGDVSNYKDYLDRLTQYTTDLPDSPDPPVTPMVPEIDGFTPLFARSFDFGLDFIGDVTYATDGEKAFLVYKDGTVLPVAQREVAQIQWGKVIDEQDGKLGVSDVFGNTILPCEYERIEIKRDTILAIDGTTASTYAAGERVATHIVKETCTLIDENYLFCDGAYRDIRFTRLSAGGYPYFDTPHEGMAIIYDERTGLLGYCSVDGEIIAYPQFIEASRFCHGTAVAYTVNGTALVLDARGRVLHKAENKRIYDCHDGLRVFREYGAYGVMDENFSIVKEAYFYDVYAIRAFGSLLIVRQNGKFVLFSVPQNRYVSDEYDSIEYADGLFICRDADGYSVLDCNAKPIADMYDLISYGDGVFVFRREGRVNYYAKKGKSV